MRGKEVLTTGEANYQQERERQPKLVLVEDGTSGPQAQGDQIQQLLQEERMRFAAQGAALELCGYTLLPPEREAVNLKEFFRVPEHRDFRIFEDMVLPRILSAAKGAPEESDYLYLFAEIKKPISLVEIFYCLPSDSWAEVRDIAGYIRAQQKGRPGPLLTSGLSNVALIRGELIRGQVDCLMVFLAICQNRDPRQWRVDGWPVSAKDSGGLIPGHRILYRHRLP